MSRFRIDTPWTKWPLEAPVSATGAGTYYPLILDLEQAMRYYYRCRNWRMTWTLGAGVHAGTYSEIIDPTYGLATLTDEEELVINGAVAGYPATPEPARWSINGTAGPTSGITMLWNCAFMDQLGQDGTDYLPSFDFNIEPGDGNSIYSISAASPLAGYIDFDGIASIPYYSVDGTSDFSGVLIEPIADFWEYRDSGGLNPIYDITDGSVLIPVFNNGYAYNS